MYCIVLYCILLYCIVLYCIVLYCTVLYCTVLHCTVLYCTVLYCIVLYCTILYCIVFYCIVSYRIVSYRTVPYRTVPYRTVSYRIVSYRIVSFRFVSYRIVSDRIVSYRIVSYRIVSACWARKASRQVFKEMNRSAFERDDLFIEFQPPRSVPIDEIRKTDNDPVLSMGVSCLDLKRKHNEQIEKYRLQFSKTSTQELEGHRKKVYAVAWNCKGDKLASGSHDTHVGVWNVDHSGPKLEIMLRGHTDAVNALVWSTKQPGHLASVSDSSLRVWDTRARKAMARLPCEHSINSTWSPDGLYIAVGNKKDVVSIVDSRTWTVVKQNRFHREVNEMMWHPNMQYFLCGTYDGSGQGFLEVYSFPDFKLIHQLKANNGSCQSIAVSPDCKYFATGGSDALVTLWDMNELAPVRSYTHSSAMIRSVSFSHEGTFLASGSEDGSICIYEASTASLIHKIDCPATGIASLCFNTKNNLLAFALERDRNLEREARDRNEAPRDEFRQTHDLERFTPLAGETRKPRMVWSEFDPSVLIRTLKKGADGIISILLVDLHHFRHFAHHLVGLYHIAIRNQPPLENVSHSPWNRKVYIPSLLVKRNHFAFQTSPFQSLPTRHTINIHIKQGFKTYRGFASLGNNSLLTLLISWYNQSVGYGLC
eukprot:g23723.t1